MRRERVPVDALAARMVSDPLGLDVVVASNLFGDVLTDLAAALQGGMGTAASASIAPGSDTPGIFEAPARLMQAIEAVCRRGPRTADLGGDASKVQVGDAIAEAVRG